jgi:hypothetical protein
MKLIKAYWENKVFDPKPENCIYSGYMVPTKHFVELEVADDATDEEIEMIAHRKDVKIIK